MSHVAFVAAGICALPGLVFLLIARGAARRRRWQRMLLGGLAGRYDGLADERGKPRTVFTLGRTQPFDLFDVVRRFGRLSALLDAEYGSATFVGARGVAAYEILVSTSGLLARPLGETRASPARHGFGRLAHRRSKLQFTSWTTSPSLSTSRKIGRASCRERV